MAKPSGWTTVRRAEAFCLVADTQSWKRASQLLGGARPESRTAWHLVKDFARDLRPGDPPTLFDSVPANERTDPERAVRLTREGELALTVAREFVESARDLRVLLAARETPLRIACYPAHLRKVVAPLLVEGRAELDVVAADDALRDDGGQPLFDMLERESVDVVIAPIRRGRRLESHPLYRWQLRAVIPASFSLAREQGPVAADELMSASLLLSPEGHTSRDVAQRVFDLAGVPLKPRYENPSTESLLAYVEAGLGIAILPEDALWPSPSTRVQRPFGPEEEIWHGLHWRKPRGDPDRRIAALIEAHRNATSSALSRGSRGRAGRG